MPMRVCVQYTQTVPKFRRGKSMSGYLILIAVLALAIFGASATHGWGD
jgi:hypothetical protein